MFELKTYTGLDLVLFTNWYFLCFCLVWVYCFYLFFINKNFLLRLSLFLLNLSFFIGWGFYYQLDGFMLLFFQVEILVFYLFCIIYTQLDTNQIFLTNITQQYLDFFKVILFSLIVSSILGYYLVPLQTLHLFFLGNYFYQFSTNIYLNDFFYFFYFFYFQFSVLVIIFGILMTLFSCFFILCYFLLKSFYHKSWKKQKYYNFLRHQNLVHQATYNATIRIFT